MTVATVDLDVRQKCLQSLLQTFPNMGTTSRGLVLTLVREFISLPSIFFLASCNYKIYYPSSRIQFSSVTQLCPTLWDPMNRNTPGLPVHHQLPEFTQTHDPRVSDAIQPSHPLSSPSPPALNPSQHQSLFQ